MRILILVDCFLPAPKSGAKQIHDLAVEFYRLGHDITVLAPADHAPGRVNLSIEDGLRVVRVETGTIKHKWRPVRALQEVRLSSILWRKARNTLLKHPCDLIVFYSPTIFFGALVRRLKALWGCPAYLILRDIFPQWTVDVGVLRRGLVFSYFRKKELQQYAAADIIAVQTHADRKYFAREFPGNRYRLEVLHNWASLEEPNLPVTRYRTELGLQDKIVFFYGGNIGVAQDMENILRLAASLSDHERAHFLLVGEGSDVSRMKQIIAAQGLRNIQILPSVGQREYLSMLSEFDVGLVTLDRRLKTHNVPGKILNYLYWSMPVLASINPGNDLFDLLNEAGFCFTNGNDKSFAVAARKLADDAELRGRLGKNGRRLLEETFSVGSAAKQIFDHLEDAGLVLQVSYLAEPMNADSTVTTLNQQKVFN
jgi:glycosyltransferase involved in cell wall biosynthesis